MVEAVMLWNEPNNLSHWDFEMDPGWEKFAEMVKLAADAVTAESPRLTKVLGGISPIDPANMTALLDSVAEQTLLVTHDSDAPGSKRLAYVGTDNVAAGRAAGREIAKALPDGGEIVIFVGRLDAQNARERKQGIEEALQGTGIEILDTRLDQGDQARAQENAEAMIVAHPGVDALVGLWSYNGPAILQAVRSAGKIGAIEIVCFDEETATLDYRVTLPPEHELAPGPMNEEGLRKLAEETGGKFYREEDLYRLADDVQPRTVTFTQRKETLLWTYWPVWALIVGLFTVEWVVRKFSNMS